MVGRLVKDNEVWLCHEHCGESHTFLLSARELSHRLVEIVYLQLCEYLSGVKMIQMVLDEYEVEEEIAARDVRGFVSELVRAGFVECTREDKTWAKWRCSSVLMVAV